METQNSQKILIAITIAAVLFLSGCIGGTGTTDDATTITLYGYSVPSEVLGNEIIPTFQESWKTQTGQEIEFETSYAGSGTVTNQIIGGTPAEIAVLSHEYDAIRLKNDGKATTDWKTFPHKGIASSSPFIIMVREGNPKNIQGWEDLTKEGVEVVHPDPSTSGGAMWSIYAIYGSGLKTQDDAYARDLLRRVEQNVVSMPDSARKAMTTFEAGIGDALITYENEAILAQRQGKNYELVYPQSTILSENPVIIIDANVAPEELEVIEAFIDSFWTTESQDAYGDYGFRPVDEAVLAQHTEYPEIPGLFTIDYLGGWETAKSEIIDGIWTDLQSQ